MTNYIVWLQSAGRDEVAATKVHQGDDGSLLFTDVTSDAVRHDGKVAGYAPGEWRRWRVATNADASIDHVQRHDSYVHVDGSPEADESPTLFWHNGSWWARPHQRTLARLMATEQQERDAEAAGPYTEDERYDDDAHIAQDGANQG